MEEWKSIPGYEGIYEASNLGRIRSDEGKTTTNAKQTRVWKQRILKPHKVRRRKAGSYSEIVSLWKGGEMKELLVPRLVALTWCEGYAEGLTVNHIDGNPLNNKASNLEWVSLSENVRHAYRTGLNKNSKECRLVDKNGQEYRFYSLQEASRFLGRKPKYLSVAIGQGTKIYSSKGEIYGLV